MFFGTKRISAKAIRTTVGRRTRSGPIVISAYDDFVYAQIITGRPLVRSDGGTLGNSNRDANNNGPFRFYYSSFRFFYYDKAATRRRVFLCCLNGKTARTLPTPARGNNSRSRVTYVLIGRCFRFRNHRISAQTGLRTRSDTDLVLQQTASVEKHRPFHKRFDDAQQHYEISQQRHRILVARRKPFLAPETRTIPDNHREVDVLSPFPPQHTIRPFRDIRRFSFVLFAP